MGTEYFELTPNGPARIAVEWVDDYRGIEVYLDRKHLASIPNRIAFQRGQMIQLPDGNALAIRLKRVGIGYNEVQAAINGRRLKVTARQRRRREAYQAIWVVAGITLFVGLVSLGTPRSSGLETTIYLGAALTFFILGQLVRNRSQGALSIAIVLYGLDTLLAVVVILNTKNPSFVPLIMHTLFLIPMVRAYGKLGEDDWFSRGIASSAISTTPIDQRLHIDLQLDSPASALSPASASSSTRPATIDPLTCEKLSLAIRLYRIGSNKPEARKLLKEVLQQYPKWAEAWYAVAYMVDDPDERQKVLDRVLQLDPNHPGASKIRLKQTMGKAFMDEFRVPADAISVGGNVNTLQQQAADAIKAGNSAQARLMLRRAITIDPNNADTWFVASFLTNDSAVRHEILRQALKCDPAHEMVQQAFGKLDDKEQLFPDLDSPTWEPRQ
ncbi:MAG: hypothetical protein KF716_05400 [Anaerolineae bacterium]|nr:hypothetical protein [Anaerolineae bacterium]